MTDYEKSNKYDRVSLNRFRHTEYNALLSCGDDITERKFAAQMLLNYLCEKFGIAGVSLYVSPRPQLHTNKNNGNTKSKIYGCYYTNEHKITIYNKTAKLNKVVSIKVFADTLLHEFMHHYDYQYLKLGDSLHTAGFYKRIGDLKRKLEC